MQKGQVKPLSGLNLRKTPAGEKMETLRHHQTVTILNEVTYYRIETADGHVGFVDGNFIEKVAEETTGVRATDFNTIDFDSAANDVDLATQHFEPVEFTHERFMGSKVTVDKDFVPHLETLAHYASTCNLKIWVTSSLRPLHNKVQGAIVKPASNSCHHIGHAIDMNLMHQRTLYNSSKLKKSNHSNLPLAILQFFDLIRNDPALRWGGDFTTEDPVHIDDNLFHRNKDFYLAKIDKRVELANA